MLSLNNFFCYLEKKLFLLKMILSLHSDVAKLIFKRLDPRSLGACTQVCKWFREQANPFLIPLLLEKKSLFQHYFLALSLLSEQQGNCNSLSLRGRVVESIYLPIPNNPDRFIFFDNNGKPQRVNLYRPQGLQVKVLRLSRNNFRIKKAEHTHHSKYVGRVQCINTRPPEELEFCIDFINASQNVDFNPRIIGAYFRKKQKN